MTRADQIAMPDASSDYCWMLLIRHGATANNDAVPPRLQGARSDPPLSDAGMRQADRLADFLARLPIREVFSSPLLRARQTAECIARVHCKTTSVVEQLHEIDCGRWEGLTWDDVERQWPEHYRDFVADPVHVPYLGGENLLDVERRVAPALRRLADDHRGKMIVVVAHNMVNRCYLAHHLRTPLADYRKIVQENGGINLIRCSGDAVRIVMINSLWHLADFHGFGPPHKST